jgi:hypothetical protein
MFGDYPLIWCKGIENGVADWLSRAPLLGGYCPDDGETEKEKYKCNDEGNLIFNEIDDDEKLSPQHSKCPPPIPPTSNPLNRAGNGTRGSSGQEEQRDVQDVKTQDVKSGKQKLDAASKKVGKVEKKMRKRCQKELVPHKSSAHASAGDQGGMR